MTKEDKQFLITGVSTILTATIMGWFGYNFGYGDGKMDTINEVNALLKQSDSTVTHVVINVYPNGYKDTIRLKQGKIRVETKSEHDTAWFERPLDWDYTKKKSIAKF